MLVNYIKNLDLTFWVLFVCLVSSFCYESEFHYITQFDLESPSAGIVGMCQYAV